MSSSSDTQVKDTVSKSTKTKMTTYAKLPQFLKQIELFCDDFGGKFYVDQEVLKEHSKSYWSDEKMKAEVDETLFAESMLEYMRHIAGQSNLAVKDEVVKHCQEYWQRFLSSPSEGLVEKFKAMSVSKPRVRKVKTEGDAAAVKVKKDSTCTSVLKSGPNKGKACGKACAGDFCATHASKEKSVVASAELEDDPIDEFSQPSVEEGHIPTMKEVIKKVTKRKLQKKKPHGKICDDLLRKMIVEKRIKTVQFRKNVFGNYELYGPSDEPNDTEDKYRELVYDFALKKVIGKQMPDGTVQELALNDIELCKALLIDCILPSKLGEIEVKKSGVHEVEDDYSDAEEDVEDDEEEA